jgi:hypothetical protein
MINLLVVLEKITADRAETESKEKHGVWVPVPQLTITSLYVHSKVNYNTFIPWATLCQSRLYPPVRDFGFGLCFSLQEF